MSPLLVVPHPSLLIEAHRCGPEDLEPMLDRLETLLHEDYFFRRKHFAAILARPQAAVFAILVEKEFAAICIIYSGSTLTNLYVHPEHKAQGVGKAVLAYFQPSVVRAKGNMSQGDPVGFYEKNGYKAVGADPAKPHIVIMEKEKAANATPAAPQLEPMAGGKPQPSPARLEQLARMREKSRLKRLAAKQEADKARLIAAGIDAERAHILAYGTAPTVGEGGEASRVPSSPATSPPTPPPQLGAVLPPPESSISHWPFSD